MAFSSGKPRTSSPFRFHKPSSLNENIPGMFQHLAPMASSSHYMGSNLTSKTQSFVGRSLTPGRGRITSPASSATPQKYRFSSTSSAGSCSPLTPTSDRLDYMKDYQKAKESVLVTIRFRPLSAREIQRGDEVAWYADGDMTVRSEYNPGTAYGYDRVFGPATTTRRIYDTAARQVVQGAMEGINGTVFAYGVTSSGKTHTMHGDHKSPGIIPLAVKDVFSIIQETPGREFLLRVSYLEIYNEVINDLLDPTGQNLRVREDSQGTYVEGIKEEVVLSPAHALSLITAGEEHRHVGSNNFNLFSSRSHTIFTLTIESSASTSDYDNDEITLSQLNLIDLAGSESSKTETTGLRRKEGSYINKSLLTLGTVISKLSDGKASHVPYRDSKLTRLLQSSLSGHGRVSLICTITPASSNAEETHNTLKFAHRAKRMEIYAAPNRIMDEKSLIKKYQKEISSLKHELDQLKRGILDKPYLVGSSQEDLLSLRQQLEAGQVKLQSRLEEEEQAKAALMGRIQRLTKLILVSSKNSIPATLPEQAGHRRRHSFGEEELAYLTDRRHGLVSDANDNSVLVGQNTEISIEGKGDGNGAEESVKEEKKTKRRSMLAWFKHRKNENFHLSPVMSFDAENSPSVSPASIISTAVQIDQTSDCKGELQKPTKQRVDGLAPVINSFPQATQAGELFSATVCGRRPPPTGETMADQMDLLREQVKMLAGEVALCTSSLKRLSEQAASNPDDIQLRSQMQKTRENIEEKKRQIQVLEQRILGTGDAASNNTSSFELSQTISKLMSQLNEKAFELEIKTADNRILQEQLQAKISENGELQETIASLRQQLTLPTKKSRKNKSGSRCSASCRMANGVTESCRDNEGWLRSSGLSGELEYVEEAVDANESDSDSCSSMQSLKKLVDPGLQSQMLMQASKLERLKQEKVQLMEEKEGLRIQAQKLAEEASYAKELASAAAVELKNLAEEVTKLSFQNSKLVNDLAIVQDRAFARATAKPVTGNGYAKHIAHSGYQIDGDFCIGGQADGWIVNGDNDVSSDFYDDIDSWKLDPEDLKRELHARKEREAGLEAVLADKEQIEAELHKKLEEAKQREADLENDLAGMWVLVGKLKKEREAFNNFTKPESYNSSANDALRLDWCGMKVKDLDVGDKVQEDLRTDLEDKRRRCAELETLISQLKSEELDGLDASAMDDLQSLHVEALTKLCQAKARKQERLERDREREPDVSVDQPEEERNGHICKVCFEAPTAAVLLPCRHFCLCKPCAVACTECPLCRSGIADIIITFTS